MNESLLDQAKKYLATAIPSTVNIDMTVCPGLPSKIDVCFLTDFKKQMESTQSEKSGLFAPSRILKSGNRTIVFWHDGTKTIVKRTEDEPDNDYAAFTAALGIKIFGSNSALRRMIKKSFKVQKRKEKNRWHLAFWRKTSKTDKRKTSKTDNWVMK